MAAHDDKPLPYEGRILDTKGVAQRLDLDYLQRPNRFRDLRRRLTWAAPIVAFAAVLPFVLGVRQKVFSSGPVSKAHAVFENNCELCHTSKFSAVSDQSCQQCHDGPQHPAKAIDTARITDPPRCTVCHAEHRGRDLAQVVDANCVACHSTLRSRASGVKLQNVSITAFRDGRHPDFAARNLKDERPLKLNHAIHMPVETKTIRGIKLPMKCSDCHSAGRAKSGADLEPVSFDRHCESCHKRELEFVLPELHVDAPPAPHNRDPRAIRGFIRETYVRLLAADPTLASRPLGRGLAAEPNAVTWLGKASERSEEYLFQKKCVYCHEYARVEDGLPVVKAVAPVVGHYVAGKKEGEAWLARGEFNHRAHRAVSCSSCHSTARASTRTSDVLMPAMKSCTACHGSSDTSLDRCAQCHLYHNKLQEIDRDRRSIEELLGVSHP